MPAPTRARRSSAGCAGTRGFISTSPRRVPPGSTWWNAGSPRSPANGFVAVLSRAWPIWSMRSKLISPTTMPTPSLSAGQKTLRKSWKKSVVVKLRLLHNTSKLACQCKSIVDQCRQNAQLRGLVGRTWPAGIDCSIPTQCCWRCPIREGKHSCLKTPNQKRPIPNEYRHTKPPWRPFVG